MCESDGSCAYSTRPNEQRCHTRASRSRTNAEWPREREARQTEQLMRAPKTSVVLNSALAARPRLRRVPSSHTALLHAARARAAAHGHSRRRTQPRALLLQPARRTPPKLLARGRVPTASPAALPPSWPESSCEQAPLRASVRTHATDPAPPTYATPRDSTYGSITPSLVQRHTRRSPPLRSQRVTDAGLAAAPLPQSRNSPAPPCLSMLKLMPAPPEPRTWFALPSASALEPPCCLGAAEEQREIEKRCGTVVFT